MKVFFATLLLVLFWFTPKIALAVPPYPLEVSSVGTTITVTVSGLPADASRYELYNGPKAIGPNNGISTDSWIRTQASGSITWQLSGMNIVPNSTYYFHVKKISSGTSIGTDPLFPVPLEVTETKTFQFGTASTTNLISDFSVEPSSQREVIVSGKINNNIHSTNNLEVVFLWSPTSSFEGTSEPSDRRQVVTGVAGQASVSEEGIYTLRLTELSPGTMYYFKQLVRIINGSTIDTRTHTFDTDQGYIGTGTAKETSLFNSKTYHLLAPWPGLSVLMDPDLCLQKKAAKEVPENAICDVNGFLNFAFKLLIGLTAVILVLRLIYEGYQYIVTDIPFLKASAKSGFFTSLLGLLLALSAFLILNTINPKLVDNTISIDSVDVGVDEDTDTDPIIQDPSSTVPSGRVAACTDGIIKVATAGGTFTSCKSISANFKAMIDLAWAQGMKISGGGFRTRQQQIALRAAHCGGSSQFNVYEKSSSLCRPPTARPGKSNHESGLAFDLTCNGQTIRSRDNACFVWLQANARKYGLINFSKEPWHWSVDGK
jgi:hypothetical protein